MTIFVVWRTKDKKFMGGYVDMKAIFELPPDTYTVCVAEEDKVTECQTITLNKDTSVVMRPLEVSEVCPAYGFIYPEECPRALHLHKVEVGKKVTLTLFSYSISTKVE